MAPFISIIIPVHNEEKTISRVLKSVLNQKYPSFEVIVVDDYSTDKSAEIISRYKVKYIKNKKNLGLAKTINKGIRLAKGEIVGILHADCIPVGDEWLSNLVPFFEDPSVGAVTSLLDFNEDELSLFDKIFIDSYTNVWKYRDVKRPSEVEFVNDKCDLYRKGLIEKLGLFDESFSEFSAGEDLDISFRIRNTGYKIILNPTTRVVHLLGSHQDTLLDHLKKSVIYATVDPLIYKKHGYSFRLGYFFSFSIILISLVAWEHPILSSLVLVFVLIFCFIHKRTINHLGFGLFFGLLEYSLIKRIAGLTFPLIPFSFIAGLLTYYAVVALLQSFQLVRRFQDFRILLVAPPIYLINIPVLVYGFIRGLVRLAIYRRTTVF